MHNVFLYAQSEGRHTLVRHLPDNSPVLQVFLESVTPDDDRNTAPVSEKSPCFLLSHRDLFFVAASTN
jgi:hypothetical protein